MTLLRHPVFEKGVQPICKATVDNFGRTECKKLLKEWVIHYSDKLVWKFNLFNLLYKVVDIFDFFKSDLACRLMV